METIVIKLNQAEKAEALIKFLESIDYISNVAFFDKYVNAKKLFDEINKIANKTELSHMTLEEINREVNAYRCVLFHQK